MTVTPAPDVESTNPEPIPARPWRRVIAILAITAAIALAMLYPGDAPLNVDESALLAFAADANARWMLVDQGLTGSVSFCYGPVPAQIYQLLLLCTRQIELLVMLHAALFLGTIAAALWSIGRTLRMYRFGFIAFALATPWVWFYARDLWDNPFCIPISCVALAAYGKWLTRADHGSEASPLAAITWSASVALLPIVHAVGLPTSLAVMGHAIFRRWKVFRRSLPWIALGILLASSTSWPYLKIATKQLMQRIDLRIAGYPTAGTEGMGRPAAPRAGRWVSASYALLSASGISAEHEYFQPPDELPVDRWLAALRWPGWMAHVWLAVGIIVAWRSRTPASDTGNEAERSFPDSRRSLLLVAICSLLLLGLEFFLAHTGRTQQYYSGVFAPVVVLCWVGVERLWRWNWTRWALVILPGAAVVGSTILIAVAIHGMGGAPHPYGPTVRNRVALASQLAARRPDKIYCNNDDLNRWPDLLPLAFWPKIASPHRAPVALIAHRHAFPGDFWLIVEYRDPPDDSFLPIQFQRP